MGAQTRSSVVRPWECVISEEELAVYSAAGYGGRIEPRGFLALIVIDVTYGFVGRYRQPILESIAEYPNSCGEAGWDSVPNIVGVLHAAREIGAPVFFTAGAKIDRADRAGQWRHKHPRTLSQPDDAQEIIAELQPMKGEIEIRKTKPSAFHGTPLVDALIDAHVETLVVTGCTTSGCVRATVIDAFSYGLNTIVVEDGVFDRGRVVHAVNLFDMSQKYADVMPADEVVVSMRELHRKTSSGSVK